MSIPNDPKDPDDRLEPSDAETNPAVLEALGELDRIEAFHHGLISGAPDGGPADPNEPTPPADPPVRPTPSPSSRWGRLEIREKLGQGAFGEVYLAHDPVLCRDVALKLYNREVGSGGRSTGQAPGFLREARLMAKVQHRNMVAIHDVEIRDGRLGIEMELVRGETLTEVLRRQVCLRADEAILIGIDLCRALASLHAQHVVHRDLKPENVIREAGGRIVLMDLGVGLDISDASSFGNMGGSPLYMPPEAFSGASARPSSDIYSLGVLLFHLVTGRLPVEASSYFDLIARHERGERTPLASLNADLPASFVNVVETALSADPHKRYRTAGEMAAALGAALEGRTLVKSKETPRWMVIAVAGVAVAAAALGIWQLRSGRSGSDRAEDLRVSQAEATRKVGEWRLHTGHYPEAIELLEESRRLLESASAGKHPEMVKILNGLGAAYASQNRLAEGRSVQMACLDLALSLYGEDSPLTASIYSDLANVCEQQQDFAAANGYFEEALDIMGRAPIASADGRTEGAGVTPNQAETPVSQRDPGASIREGARVPIPGLSSWTSYTYFAEFVHPDREQKHLVPLQLGDQIGIGDLLALRFRGSIPLFVYVLNQDLQGNVNSLFPLPGISPGNPVPANSEVLLPGSSGGNRKAWKTSSAGGEERFLIVTSPSRIDEIEELVAVTAIPTDPGSVARDRIPMPPSATLRLRGIGGLEDLAVKNAVGPEAASQGIEEYLSLAAALSDSAEQATGTSFRRFWLKNPRGEAPGHSGASPRTNGAR